MSFPSALIMCKTDFASFLMVSFYYTEICSFKKMQQQSQKENGVHTHRAVKFKDLFKSISYKTYIIH